MDTVSYVRLVCMLLAGAVYAVWTGRTVQAFFKREDTDLRCMAAGFFCIEILLAAEHLMQAALPLYYLAWFGALTLFLYSPGRSHAQWWLAVTVCFLCLASGHQILTAMTALVLGRAVSDVLADPFLSSLCMGGALAFGLAGSKVLAGRAMGRIRWISVNMHEAYALLVFTWCSSGFTVLQGIPVMYRFPARLVSMFLVGSSVLLLMMLYLFVGNTVHVLQDMYLEEEHRFLERQRREAEERQKRLERDAYVDVLTGAVTRRRLMLDLETWIREGLSFTLVYIDLDGLKTVNDAEGHSAGDIYLTDFAARMRKCLRKEDILARVGGDEFVAAMPGSTLAASLKRMGWIRETFSRNGSMGRAIPFSFGAADSASRPGILPEQLLAYADRMMYEDKQRRKRAGTA